MNSFGRQYSQRMDAAKLAEQVYSSIDLILVFSAIIGEDQNTIDDDDVASDSALCVMSAYCLSLSVVRPL